MRTPAAADFGDGMETALPTGTVMINAGQTTARISLRIYDDSVSEPRESYTVTISNLMPMTIGATTYTLGTAVANGSIAINDGAPIMPSTDCTTLDTVTEFGYCVDGPPGNVSEGSRVVFIIRRKGRAGTNNVSYTISAADTNGAQGPDFGTISDLTFPTGSPQINAAPTLRLWSLSTSPTMRSTKVPNPLPSR